MAEPISKEIRAVVRETLQRVIDELQFYADEMEMQRLPVRDGANAVRIAVSAQSGVAAVGHHGLSQSTNVWLNRLRIDAGK